MKGKYIIFTEFIYFYKLFSGNKISLLGRKNKDQDKSVRVFF